MGPALIILIVIIVAIVGFLIALYNGLSRSTKSRR